MIEEVREVKQGNEDALNLAKILIRLDAWKHTHKPLPEVTPVISYANNHTSANEHREESSSTKPGDVVNPIIIDQSTLSRKNKFEEESHHHHSEKSWKKQVKELNEKKQIIEVVVYYTVMKLHCFWQLEMAALRLLKRY